MAETVRKGIIDVELYSNSTEVLLLGNVAALGGKSWSTQRAEKMEKGFGLGFGEGGGGGGNRRTTGML